ncbi:hypothetical protein [Flavobacterium limicola]|uniref:hypothetical protein n=1 Tax=Flavobacterium limicola TaxID=180441 RepID=UPI000EAE51D3|nr:hypothetical protein [Flavobacterium limicola]
MIKHYILLLLISLVFGQPKSENKVTKSKPKVDVVKPVEVVSKTKTDTVVVKNLYCNNWNSKRDCQNSLERIKTPLPHESFRVVPNLNAQNGR